MLLCGLTDLDKRSIKLISVGVDQRETVRAGLRCPRLQAVRPAIDQQPIARAAAVDAQHDPLELRRNIRIEGDHRAVGGADDARRPGFGGREGNLCHG